MRNHEVTKIQPLLNEQGNLFEPGWFRKLVQQYDRNAIKALPFVRYFILVNGAQVYDALEREMEDADAQ